jgi:hypothetical protein
MADYNVTVVESLRLFGVQPSDKWQQYNWNAFLWGEGTNAVLASASPLIAESQSFTDDLTTAAEFNRQVDEAITLSGAPSSEVLRDGNGYVYVFPSAASDGEDRDPVDWASGTTASATWSSQAAASTTWS